MASERGLGVHRLLLHVHVQGYFAHKKTPTPYDPGHRPTVGSLGRRFLMDEVPLYPIRIRAPAVALSRGSGDTTACRMTGVNLHGVVSPESAHRVRSPCARLPARPERDRARERESERHREREREIKRQRGRAREREGERGSESERERARVCVRERERARVRLPGRLFGVSPLHPAGLQL